MYESVSQSGSMLNSQADGRSVSQFISQFNGQPGSKSYIQPVFQSVSQWISSSVRRVSW